MQRTYIFTEGKAVVYNTEKKAVEEKPFRFVYSSLYDNDDKIMRQAEKALKTRIIAVSEYKHIAELRTMPDDKFYDLSECKETSEYVPAEKPEK